MKLQYLTQVQTLLNEYDFQDKYKVMLELEEYLSKLEEQGTLSREQLLTTLGTPADFVADVVGTYDLSKLSAEEMKASATTSLDTDELLEESQVADTEQKAEDDTLDINPVTEQDNNNENDDDINSDNSSTTDTQNQESKNIDENKVSESSNNAQSDNDSKKKKSKANKKSSGSSKAIKLIFGILTAIFFFIAFLGLAFTLVVSIGLFFVIDMQTAISLFVGILLLLIAIGLSIGLVKNILLSIAHRELKTVKIILSLLFIILFAFISKIMLTSTMETISMYVTNNLYAVQNVFYNYNIDVSNIDWANLDLGESMKLMFDVIKSVL